MALFAPCRAECRFLTALLASTNASDDFSAPISWPVFVPGITLRCPKLWFNGSPVCD